MIEVWYKGRLGNNLFEYAVGRLLAEQMGYRLRCSPIPGFPRTRDVVEGDEFESDPVRFSRHDLDISGLRAGRYYGRKIVLDGYFQCYDYFKGELHKIREWFRLDNVEPALVPGPDDLVVHWRIGDYLRPRRPHWALPPSFVRSVIRSGNWNKVLAVTGSPGHRFIDEIREDLDDVISSVDPVVDFETVRRANNILMSTSSFSWWAAVLSVAQRIFYPEIYNWSPMTVHFLGAKIPCERLFPYDQARFEKVPRSKILRTAMTAVRIPTYGPRLLFKQLAHWPLVYCEKHMARNRADWSSE